MHRYAQVGVLEIEFRHVVVRRESVLEILYSFHFEMEFLEIHIQGLEIYYRAPPTVLFGDHKEVAVEPLGSRHWLDSPLLQEALNLVGYSFLLLLAHSWGTP